jgi:DTW domain-containing protein YfiP
MSWSEDNPRYCSVCRKAKKVCVCAALIPETSAEIDVLILRSQSEVKRSRGTAWPLSCLVQNISILDGDEVLGFEPEDGDYLLFPKKDQDITEDSPVSDDFRRVKRLIIPDGTWSEARRMVRTTPFLSSLPRMELKKDLKGEYKLRRAIGIGKISTLEAFREALSSLDLLSNELEGRLSNLLDELNRSEFK